MQQRRRWQRRRRKSTWATKMRYKMARRFECKKLRRGAGKNARRAQWKRGCALMCCEQNRLALTLVVCALAALWCLRCQDAFFPRRNRVREAQEAVPQWKLIVLNEESALECVETFCDRSFSSIQNSLAIKRSHDSDYKINNNFTKMLNDSGTNQSA